VTGVSFRLSLTVPCWSRWRLPSRPGTILPPPITRISLEEVPARLGAHGHADGKTRDRVVGSSVISARSDDQSVQAERPERLRIGR
jgi:hypothetical protein